MIDKPKGTPGPLYCGHSGGLHATCVACNLEDVDKVRAAAPAMQEALQEITNFAYRLAMKAPDLNPEGDRIILAARAALRLADGKDR